MTLDVGLASDVGREREINQDSAGVTEVGRGILLVVADGMGGHVAGEQAARIVVESLFTRFDDQGQTDPRDNLYYGILAAHEGVLAYAVEHATHGMGSTVVAALVTDHDAWIAHVGDSRLYLFRRGRVEFVTTDHTRVQMMVEMGLLTAQQAKEHPEGNVITRAVGHDPHTRGATFEADVRREPLELEDGDTLLLCSDGLYDLVDDREMIGLVSGRAAQGGAQALVDLANARGGHDNITVLVAHLGEGTPPPADDLSEDTVEDRVATTVEDEEIPEPPPGWVPDGVAAPAADAPAPERRLRRAVLGLSGLVVALVAAVIVLVARSGAPPPPPAVPPPDPPGPVVPTADDDDSAPADDDDSAGDDDDSGGP